MLTFDLIFCWGCDGTDDEGCDQEHVIRLKANAASFASIPAVGDEFDFGEGVVVEVLRRRFVAKPNPPSVRLFCKAVSS
jgi:hypothetical protein